MGRNQSKYNMTNGTEEVVNGFEAYMLLDIK